MAFDGDAHKTSYWSVASGQLVVDFGLWCATPEQISGRTTVERERLAKPTDMEESNCEPANVICRRRKMFKILQTTDG
jgi:hypothetical protein